MKIPLVVFHLLKVCSTVAMTEGRHKLMNLTGVESYIKKQLIRYTIYEIFGGNKTFDRVCNNHE